MNLFAEIVTRYKKTIVLLFLGAALICAGLFVLVKINYNMVDYLPPSAQSTVALDMMSDEFEGVIPNARVMVKDVSVREAIEYKQKLSSIKGVSEVLWLDDTIDVKKPLEMYEVDTVETFYKDNKALFSVAIQKGFEIEVAQSLREVVGENNALSGEAIDIAVLQLATGDEVANALMILLPIVILLLIFASTSWIEPLLYLGAIGISIVINMGTNLIFGQISFMTNSVGPILQLAVTLDYAIFLLHSFDDHRKKGLEPVEAMKAAVKDSFSTILSCAIIAIAGFLALLSMEFRIGADMGLVLAKGVLLSFLSVVVLLPALALLSYKLIDKTKHRPFMPTFRNANRIFSKFAIPAIVIVVIIIAPSFLGQNQTEFVYGKGNVAAVGKVGEEKKEISDTFGEKINMVLLVPRGDVGKEQLMGEELKRIPQVTGLVSYANQVGNVIPHEFLDKKITSQFYSENLSRIILYLDTPEEGPLAFSVVESVMETARSYYGEKAYSTGQSANIYDMKKVVDIDRRVLNLVVIIAVFLVLVVMFKSPILPVILILTIEAAIWLNLSIPYFTGVHINFIGFLVLDTLQLVATVDYGILLTNHYMRNRKTMLQKEAMHKAMGTAFRSILVSAVVLAAAGFTLFATSTNAAVSDIGLLLGRGTLLSLCMVLFLLPGLLKVFDGVIAKTTWRADFYRPNKRSQRAKLSAENN